LTRIVKLAQVGCGSIAQRMIMNRLKAPSVKEKVELIATMDVVSERAKACMEKFGAKEWYDDYDKMLLNADIDAVTIATPIGLHYEQVIKAIYAEKHVHCHKTITTNAREATDIIEVAKQKNIKVVASPGTSVMSPIVTKIKQVLEKGTIGKVYWAQLGRQWEGHEYEPFRKFGNILTDVDPSWYYKKGGGPMYDMGVYELTELTAIFGPAKKVSAMSGIGLRERKIKDKAIDVEMDDNTMLLLDFGNSMFAYIFATFSALADEGPVPPFSISGSEGGMRLGKFKSERYKSILDIWSPSLPEKHEQEIISGYREDAFFDVMHLVDCVKNDEKPIVMDNIESMQIARHVIEIIEKGYIAAKTGKTQELETTF